MGLWITNAFLKQIKTHQITFPDLSQFLKFIWETDSQAGASCLQVVKNKKNKKGKNIILQATRGYNNKYFFFLDVWKALSR